MKHITYVDKFDLENAARWKQIRRDNPLPEPIKISAEDYGKRVKSRRKALNLKQAQVASWFQVSNATLSNIERGKPEKINLEFVYYLAELLDCTIYYLLGETDDPEERRPEKLDRTSDTERFMNAVGIRLPLPLPLAVPNQTLWMNTLEVLCDMDIELVGILFELVRYNDKDYYRNLKIQLCAIRDASPQLKNFNEEKIFGQRDDTRLVREVEKNPMDFIPVDFIPVDPDCIK